MSRALLLSHVAIRSITSRAHAVMCSGHETRSDFIAFLLSLPLSVSMTCWSTKHRTWTRRVTTAQDQTNRALRMNFMMTRKTKWRSRAGTEWAIKRCLSVYSSRSTCCTKPTPRSFAISTRQMVSGWRSLLAARTLFFFCFSFVIWNFLRSFLANLNLL